MYKASEIMTIMPVVQTLSFQGRCRSTYLIPKVKLTAIMNVMKYWLKVVSGVFSVLKRRDLAIESRLK